MIAVEMLCVVDTGMPKCAASESTVAELVFRREAMDRVQLHELVAQGLDDAPAAVAVPSAITTAQVILVQVAISLPRPASGA
jgi:hypothetical protein